MSMIRLSQPWCAAISAPNEVGRPSQKFDAVRPLFHISFKRFGRTSVLFSLAGKAIVVSLTQDSQPQRRGLRLQTLSATCVIAGGGPAGMMTALLLARAGVVVFVFVLFVVFLCVFRGVSFF